jgi:hypothetical protein
LIAANVGELDIYRNAYRVADTQPGLSYAGGEGGPGKG